MLNNAVEEGFVNRSRREDSIRVELTQIETGRLSSGTDLAVLSPITVTAFTAALHSTNPSTMDCRSETSSKKVSNSPVIFLPAFLLVSVDVAEQEEAVAIVACSEVLPEKLILKTLDVFVVRPILGPFHLDRQPKRGQILPTVQDCQPHFSRLMTGLGCRRESRCRNRNRFLTSNLGKLCIKEFARNHGTSR
jgi:hypothetical protein